MPNAAVLCIAAISKQVKTHYKRGSPCAYIDPQTFANRKNLMKYTVLMTLSESIYTRSHSGPTNPTGYPSPFTPTEYLHQHKPIKNDALCVKNTTPWCSELLPHAKDSYLGNKVHRQLYHICLHTCSSLEWMHLEGAVLRAAISANTRMRWRSFWTLIFLNGVP